MGKYMCSFNSFKLRKINLICNYFVKDKWEEDIMTSLWRQISGKGIYNNQLGVCWPKDIEGKIKENYMKNMY